MTPRERESAQLRAGRRSDKAALMSASTLPLQGTVGNPCPRAPLCCSPYEHYLLLVELEDEASSDPDIAALLNNARDLLSTSVLEEVGS